MKIFDFCPVCGKVQENNLFIELRDYNYPLWKRAYDKIVSCYNNMICFAAKVLGGGWYDGSSPEWINNITSRTRFRIPFAYKLLNLTLPHTKRYYQFYLKCKNCGKIFCCPHETDPRDLTKIIWEE